MKPPSIFRGTSLTRYAAMYEKSMNGSVAGIPGGIGLTITDWEKTSAAELRLEGIFPVNSSKLFDETQKFIPGFDPKQFVRKITLVHRRLFRLNRITGTARMAEKEVQLFGLDGALVTSVDRVQGASEDPSITGTYTLYFDPENMLFVRSIVNMSRNQPILAEEWHTVGEVDEERINSVRLAVLYGERHEFNRDKPGGTDDTIEAADKILNETDIEFIRRVARELAISIALLSSSTGDRLTQLMERLEVKGFFAWLDGSNALAESAAALSLRSLIPLSDLKNGVGEEEFDFEDVKVAMDEFQRRRTVLLFAQ